ncbi:MAG: acyltransferase [Phycisphaerae bacterium]
MGLANIAPYFLIMAALALLGHLIVRGWPFYADLTAQTQGRLSALDGFRGFLATGVFFHHALHVLIFEQSGEWRGPPSDFYLFIGEGMVIFFFMITGVLFWSRVLEGKLTARRLLVSRVRRLYPMYLFSFLLIAIVALVLAGFKIQETPTQLAGEIGRWLAGGLCGSPALNGIRTTRINSDVTWTLYYEWIFYLALPLLGLLFKGGRFLWLCGLVAVWYAVTRYSHHYGAMRETLVYLPFLCGMATAYLKYQESLQQRLRHWSYTLVMIALLIAAVPAFGSDRINRGWTVIFLMFPVFAGVVAGNNLFGLLTTRWASFLGHVSYSVYLLHGIVIFCLLQLLGVFMPLSQVQPWQFWLYCLPMGLAVVGISALTYRWVEAPFLVPPRKQSSLTRPVAEEPVSATRT